MRGDPVVVRVAELHGSVGKLLARHLDQTNVRSAERRHEAEVVVNQGHHLRAKNEPGLLGLGHRQTLPPQEVIEGVQHAAVVGGGAALWGPPVDGWIVLGRHQRLLQRLAGQEPVMCQEVVRRGFANCRDHSIGEGRQDEEEDIRQQVIVNLFGEVLLGRIDDELEEERPEGVVVNTAHRNVIQRHTRFVPIHAKQCIVRKNTLYIKQFTANLNCVAHWREGGRRVRT